MTAPSAWRAALEGWIFGLTFHTLTFSWWYELLRHHGRLSHPEAAAVFGLLASYVGAYGAAFAGWLRVLAGRSGLEAALLLSPAVWAGLELARGRLLTGFPWSLLGASQHAAPLVTQVADLGGVTAVSLVVAAGNALATWAALAWRARRAGRRIPGTWRVPAALLAVPAVAALYGAYRLAQEPASGGTLRAALVQGNVPQEEKWDPRERIAILAAHVEATRRAAARGARVVIWPESSVPLPLTSEPSYARTLADLARDLRVDLLVGSVHDGGPGEAGGRVFNSAFLLPGEAGAPARRYDKIHLVPFGEYVPLRRWLGPVGKLVQEASDFTPGDRPVVMEAGGARIAPLICFEAIFPSLVRRASLEGGQVMVNITNDAFLGDSAGPRQHLQLAVLRAVENRRWLLRAANTGISAVVDDRGRLVQSAPYGTAAELVADVPLRGGLTLYARAGDVVGWACVILALAATISRTAPRGGASWTRNFSDGTPP